MEGRNRPVSAEGNIASVEVENKEEVRPGDESAVVDAESKATSIETEAAAAAAAAAASSSNKQPRSASMSSSGPIRPVKKARTAYFIFADEKRAQVQAMHPGEGIAAVSKATGQLWASLSTEEKEKYQMLAAQERERVSKDLQAFKSSHADAVATAVAGAGGAVGDGGDAAAFHFCLPVARIRKICKLDPEVRGISREATVLLTRAAELFTAKIGQEAVHMAQVQNRRKLLPEDMAQVCATKEEFRFLHQDVRDLLREIAVDRQKVESKTASSKESRVAEGAKPLTSYFVAARK